MRNEAMQRLSEILEPAYEPTPAAKLQRAIELSDFGLEMKAAQIARENLSVDSDEHRRLFWEWLSHRPEAPWGDCPGTPRTL